MVVALSSVRSRSAVHGASTGVDSLQTALGIERYDRSIDREFVDRALHPLSCERRRAGDTALIPIVLTQTPGVCIYFKDDASQPTGSLKHRLARGLFTFGIVNGTIRAGTPVVEASSGSTAISEAYFARIIGVPFHAVMPTSTSPAKIAAIRAYGGNCRLVAAAAIYAEAEALAQRVGGSYLDQFTYAEPVTDWRCGNLASALLAQMDQERHSVPVCIVVGAGTGGTAVTIGRHLRSRKLHTRLCVADVKHSAFFAGYKEDDRASTCATFSRIEGVGRPRIEPSFVPELIDRMVKIPDAVSIAGMRVLSSLLDRPVGPSTGLNFVASWLLAREIGDANKEGSIATLICDGGERYAATYYDECWLASQGIVEEINRAERTLKDKCLGKAVPEQPAQSDMLRAGAFQGFLAEIPHCEQEITPVESQVLPFKEQTSQVCVSIATRSNVVSYTFGRTIMTITRFSLAALALTAAFSCQFVHSASASVIGNDLPKDLATATMVGVVEADRPITVVLSLPLRDAKGAADFVAHATKPGDRLFRHWLTPQEFAERFGADQSHYAAVASWARAHQLAIGEASISRTVLTVNGPAAQIEAAFGVKMMNYRGKDGHAFFSADRAPTVPAEIAQHVVGVIGLSNYIHFAPLVHVKPANVKSLAVGNGPGGAYNAADLRSIYAITPQMPAKPTETVAIFEQGGFVQADVDTYLKANKLPSVPVIDRNVNGYGGGVNDPSVELESVLDIDMVIGVNPAVKRVLVYEDGSDAFGVALLASLSAMANDDKAKTISISYGIDEALVGTAQLAAEGVLFTQLAAQGQAVFVSSGDQGAYGRLQNGLNAEDPGSQPLVTSVGGTTLYNTAKGVYRAEEAWNLLGSFLGATGGGVSAYWPIPAYQLYNGKSVALANGGSATLRNFPDVAAVASPVTGVAVYSALNGGWLEIGGTSASSPIWAGYYSLLNAGSVALGTGNIGFFNPELYKLGIKYGDSAVFHDVRDGSNGNASLYGIPGYNAGFGYDDTVGWGSMNGLNFQIGLLLTPAQDGTTPPDVVRGLTGTTTKTTATLKWTRVRGVKGYGVVAINRKTGAQSALQIVSTPMAKFTGLHAGTVYAFVVLAVNKGGNSQSIIYLTTQS